MFRRWAAISLACSLLSLAAPAAAQTVAADRFTLNTGPCTYRSGSGIPSGSLGKVCDTYLDTTTGVMWLKQGPGWVVTGVSGAGTPGKLAKWTLSTAIGDSSVDEYSSPAILRMAPGGDIEVNPGGKDILPTNGYDVNIGMLTKKFLTLHAAELWIETLVAQSTMATIGGRIVVAPTNTLSRDVAASSFTGSYPNQLATMCFKYNLFKLHVPGVELGSKFIMQSNGKFEGFIVIDTAVPTVQPQGDYCYQVYRNQDNSGTNDWYAGDAALDTGKVTTGPDGFIDLYSVSGLNAGTQIGPTIVGNVRTGHQYGDWAPRWAIGNLNGLYGYSGSVYGAAFGVPNGVRVTVDGANGVRIFGGDNDEKVTIDTLGNATFDGRITVGTGKNLIRNSECRVSTDDWFVFHNTGQTPSFLFNFPPWRLLDEQSTCYLNFPGTPPAGTVGLIIGQQYAAKPDQVWEASTYFGTHRNSSQVVIQFLNSSGAAVGQVGGNVCTQADGVGGVSLAGYCRSVVIATAPAGTYTVRMYMQSVYDGVNSAPYTFFVRAYLGEGKIGQTQPSEWAPAGLTEIIGGLIKTDAIEARHIQANAITAGKIAAGSITADKIQAGAVTADKISVGSLSALSANLGSVTAGSITGISISGTTITGSTISGTTINAGSGNEVAIDNSGISLQSGNGPNNAIKWIGGVSISTPSSSNHLYISGGLTIERTLIVTGTGAGAASINAPYGISTDTLISPNMLSGTGTTVIWENACACLKKNSSSLRYKENVQPLHLDGVDRLLNLTPIRYDYKDGAKGVIGLSAEDLYLVAPDAVNLDSLGRPDSVRQDALNVYFLQIIKELRAEVAALKEK